MWSRERRSKRPPESDHERRRRFAKRLRSAERSLARGRHGAAGSARSARAVRQLLEIAEEESDLSSLNRIGDLLARADLIAPGIKLFERVGRAYSDDGFWAKAIAIYRKILRYDPMRTDIRARIAFLYQSSGLPTGADASP